MRHWFQCTSYVAQALLGAVVLLPGHTLAATRFGGLFYEQSVDVDLVESTLAALREGELSTPEAVDALSSHADAASLFNGLSRGSVRVREADGSFTSWRMSTDERALLVDALGRLPWSEVALALEARRTAAADVPTRLAAMEVLATLGRSEDVRALLAWAQLEGKTDRVAAEVRTALTARLDELIQRQPDALRDLHGALVALNRSLLTPVLQGLARRPSAARLVALGELLSTVPALDPYVLAEIGHMAPRARVVPRASTRARVRRYLDSLDPVLVHEAIAAAEHLCDREAIPELIELLESSDRFAAQRAHQALVAITGQQLSKAPNAWLEWHAAVSDWWQGEAPKRLVVAVSGPPGAASLAIQELAKLRLYRDELAPLLAPCLQREEVELVLLACATLGHLGSLSSVEPLLDTLVDPNLDLRRAAYQALRRITREDHGDDPATWRAQGW